MADLKDTTVEHVQPSSEAAPAIMTTTSLAARFETYQHGLSKWEAIKQNKKPIAWCLYTFMLCCTFGFDGLAGGVVMGIVEFRRDFGTPFAGDYVVDADWQLGFQAATLFGIVGGGLLGGLLINRFGRQATIAGAYAMSVGGTFLQVFATTPAQFFGGKILTGIPLGVFTTAAPPYASEMAPMVIRGSIAAGMNFAIVLGQLIGFGVQREAAKYGDSRTYKVLFATQWGFAAVGIIFLPWFIESPYFLVAHGKAEKARRNLEKLHGADYDYDGHMAEIHESLAKQNQENESQGGFLECFNGKNWKRTLVAAGMFFVQNASGSSWVIGYMSYYFQLAGVSAADSFSITVGLSGLMVIGNVCGWFFVEWFGRRGTALWGTAILALTLLLIGIMASISAPGAVWAQVVFMAVWSFTYQGTIGAAAWPIATEAATSRLRAPTLALATMMNGLSSCIWSFSLPYAINPDKGNLGGKIAFIFGATLVFCLVFIFFLVPETKGRTFVEIDELWARGVSPRKFKKTELITVAEDNDSKQAEVTHAES